MIVDGVEVKQHPIYTDYALSQDGQVYSLPRRDGKNRQVGGNWLKQYYSRGYCFVNFGVKWGKRPFGVHYLVLETFIGPRPENMECCHNNGNGEDNNLSNLRWGTRKSNMADKIKHGTNIGPRGEKQHKSKLTEQNVRGIICAYSTGLFSQRELGRIYGVDHSVINLIVNKKIWKHIWTN